MEAQPNTAALFEPQVLTDFDLHLFTEGAHLRLYEKFGAHLCVEHDKPGCRFAVWAPTACAVSVLGEFNNWQPAAHRLERQGDSGIWSAFVPGVAAGNVYQYYITGKPQGPGLQRADPFGFRQQTPPSDTSFVWDLKYDWSDHEWLARRGLHIKQDAPLAIYEVEVGSWRRVPEEGDRPLNYRELAPRLAKYALDLGFSHVELLPIMEHFPGRAHDFQLTGYFAPASQYGAPQDLMYLIDYLHCHRIGVILAWSPVHVPAEEHGLAGFEGRPLYEHRSAQSVGPAPPRGYIFDYSRPEVRSFLLSSAFFWLDKFHADGLRLDSISPMLYLDFRKAPGEWTPNVHGGRENLYALDFLRQLNIEVYRHYPDVQTFAEEASGWPLVSYPTFEGGLGFGFKWDNSFVEEVLAYIGHDPFFRKFHHELITRRAARAGSEHFVLPLSDEWSGPGRRALLDRMPGDDWQRFANLRLLVGYFYFQPGKKLLFMGDEFGQWQQWNPQASLDWHLCSQPAHAGIQRWVGDLNRGYREEIGLHRGDSAREGFEWVDANDAEQSTLSWLRRDPERREVLLAVCNFTPVVRRNFRVGVRRPGRWREVLNSDARTYGGSGQGNFGGVDTIPFASQGLPHTLILTLPPLAILLFKHEGGIPV